MIVERVIVSCDEQGCRSSGAEGTEGWVDLGGYDICPRHASYREKAAAAALEALIEPLPVPRASGPAQGAQRRIQALVAIGWPLARLATALGMSSRALGALLRADEVTAATHRRIVVLYERLWRIGPPRATADDERAARRALAHAAAVSWVPPLAWDDIDRDVTRRAS